MGAIQGWVEIEKLRIKTSNSKWISILLNYYLRMYIESFQLFCLVIYAILFDTLLKSIEI